MEQKVALVSRGLVLLLSWWTASDNKTDLTRTGTWFGSIKIRAPCKDTKAKRRREGRTHVRVKEKSNAMQSGNMDSTALPLAPKRGTPWNNNIYIDPLIATPSELHCMAGWPHKYQPWRHFHLLLSSVMQAIWTVLLPLLLSRFKNTFFF